MAERDTVDKIAAYFHAVTREPFVYKGMLYEVRPLRVSIGVRQGYTCPPTCGGCCVRFSLDYLPSEAKPENTEPRIVKFNGHAVTIHSDMQLDHNDHHCRNLAKDTGRCNIYPVRPFSCDFELLRFSFAHSDLDRPTQLTTRLYGRGWQMLRVDGERGARCTITPPDEKTIQDTCRKLQRLDEWCQHFGVKNNRIDDILAWVESPAAITNALYLE
jgi:hypothetical protein